MSSSHSRRVLPVKLPDAPLVYASVHRARPRDASWLRPQGLSLNIKAEEAMYRLHGGRLVVNGTFITEAHVATRGAKQKNATASFWASELNNQHWGWNVLNGTCEGKPFVVWRKLSRSCEAAAQSAPCPSLLLS